MSINKFYYFDEKLSQASFQVYPTSLINEKNDILNLSMGNYIDIHFPVDFKQDSGKRMDDVIRTGYPMLFLISDRMKDILEQNKFTGWQSFPVKILDKKGNEIQGYNGLSIIGRCGPIDYNKCEIIEKRDVPNGPLVKYYKGLYIGLNKWDGSDFFLPAGTFHIITTKHVYEVIRKSKLTNVEFQNLAEIETPEYGIRKRK